MPGNKKVGDAKQGCPAKGGKVLVTVKEAAGGSVDGFAVTLMDKAMPPAFSTRAVTDKKGRAEIRRVPAGDYEILTAPPDSVSLFYAKPAKVLVTLGEGAKEVKQVQVTAKKKTMTPVMTLADKTVFAVPPTAKWDPSVVEVTLGEDHPEVAFRGKGRLKRTKNVDVFFDNECTHGLAFDGGQEADVPYGFLTQKPALKLYVKGNAKGAGKLTLKIVANDEIRPFIDATATAELELDVKEGNVVRGLVEPEIPVIAVAPAHAKHRPVTDPAIVTPPTKIVVRIDETAKEVPYEKDATFVCSNPEVELFKDAELKTAFALDAQGKAVIKNAELANGTKITLFARAKTAGTAQFKLELENVAAKGIRVDAVDPVEVGLVPATAELWRWKDADPPTEEKLGEKALGERGRFLHVQDGKGNHGRAKFVVKKLDPAHWPKSLADYTLIVGTDGASGEVKLFSEEKGGTALKLPYALTRGDLDAGDVTLWIEGASESKKARSVTLDLGVGIPNDKKKLVRNVFWVPFTVVKIEEVKPKSEFVKSTSAYKDGKFRAYVNLLNDPDGRKLEVRAKLTQKLAGVEIAFALLAHEDNRKEANNGVDKPGAWTDKPEIEAKDRDDTGAHLLKESSAEGLSDVELTLSRVAGDKYRIAAFVPDDAPLGKYKKDDATYGREPVASQVLQVWTKMWFQYTHAKSTNVPDPTAAIAAFEQIRSEFIASKRVKFDATTAPANTYYPRWMLRPGQDATQVSVIGGHNKDVFFGLFQPNVDEPRKAHIVVCDEQWDPGPETNPLFIDFGDGVRTRRVRLGAKIVKPAFEGNLVVASEIVRLGPGGGVIGAIDDSCVAIPADRDNREEVEITLPPGIPTPTAANPIELMVQIATAKGPYLGESVSEQILAVFKPNDVPDFNDTIAHEIGHSVNQTPRDGAQADCLPNHPQQVDHGQGNHCTDKACIMYESGPQATASHRFCAVCRPYLIAEDFSRWV